MLRMGIFDVVRNAEKSWNIGNRITVTIVANTTNGGIWKIGNINLPRIRNGHRRIPNDVKPYKGNGANPNKAVHPNERPI